MQDKGSHLSGNVGLQLRAHKRMHTMTSLSRSLLPLPNHLESWFTIKGWGGALVIYLDFSP